MPEREPRYRFWGSVKPAGVGVVTAKTGKTAVMKIHDPIDDWGQPFGVSAKEFGQALDALDSDTETIELHVHSPGGIAWEGIAIMNLLRQHSANVHAIVDGMAASAASYIVVGGADQVTMAPNATLMIHDASGLCVGQAADMKVMLDRLEMLSQNIAGIYADKAGGSVDDWRAAMQPETWFTADEAIEAGLADDKLSKPSSDAPTDRFDLSIFAHAGRDHAPAPTFPAKAAHKPPAKTPEQEITKGADLMSDKDKALRERLGLGDDADQATVDAKLEERLALADAADAAEPPEITEEQALAALAKAAGVEPDKVKDAVAGAAKGKVAVSQTMLDELTANAKLGAEARSKQLEQERDDSIEAAFRAGKISAERRDHWRAAWDKDPEGAKADLESLPARFPVGDAKGYAGSDNSDGNGTKPFTDDEADELNARFGVPKEALING